jgi:FAD/FMN-containing dehydrogenase
MNYEEKKELLSAKVKHSAAEKGGKMSLHKTSCNLFRNLPRNNGAVQIDKRDFNQVLAVDPLHLVAEIEGMAAYEQIIDETLKYGCLPTVVPELKTITLGGAISGCGIEASSFRYGLVHEGLLEAELLLPNGTVVCCTPENEHSDLFFALPNSYGTFGYILKAKIQLYRARKYVRLQHQRFSQLAQFFKQIQILCAENRAAGDEKADFIEGVIFNEQEAYITSATLVDQAPYLSNYKYMQIYYRSIKEKSEDYLTAADYIWRWDPDWFWCSKVFYLQNPLVRFLLGKFMLRSSVYTKIMHRVSQSKFLRSCTYLVRGNRETVIQDVLIPYAKGEEFLHFFQKEVGITPIWICPCRASSAKGYDLCRLDPEQLYLDFGFWDAVPVKDAEGSAEGSVNRKIEDKVAALKGFKSLYSNSYYTEDKFWNIFDHARYQQLKQKYDPHQLLPDLYSKVCTSALSSSFCG